MTDPELDKLEAEIKALQVLVEEAIEYIKSTKQAY